MSRRSKAAMNARFGQKFRELRRAMGLDQHEIARALGVDQSLISRMERGQVVISAPRFHDWLDLLGFEVMVKRKDAS